MPLKFRHSLQLHLFTMLKGDRTRERKIDVHGAFECTTPLPAQSQIGEALLDTSFTRTATMVDSISISGLVFDSNDDGTTMEVSCNSVDTLMETEASKRTWYRVDTFQEERPLVLFMFALIIHLLHAANTMTSLARRPAAQCKSQTELLETRESLLELV